MRLDHLLSKENIVFVLSPGCWLAPGGGKFLSLFGVWFGRLVVARFFRQDKCRTHVLCVVLGVDETRIFCGLSALLVVKGFAE